MNLKETSENTAYDMQHMIYAAYLLIKTSLRFMMSQTKIKEIFYFKVQQLHREEVLLAVSNRLPVVQVHSIRSGHCILDYYERNILHGVSSRSVKP